MQEGLAAVFGNGLSTACVVNIGAQVASVICVEVIIFFFIAFLYWYRYDNIQSFVLSVGFGSYYTRTFFFPFEKERIKVNQKFMFWHST